MTLQSRCLEALRSAPDAPAVHFQGSSHGWGLLAKIAGDIGALLDKAGVPDGARIGFAPRNRPSAIAAQIALLARGATIVMVYCYQSQAGIARDVARLGLTVFISDSDDFGADVLAAVEQAGILGIALGDDGAVARGERRGHAPAAAGEPQLHLLTSGTTGPPKHHPFSYAQIDRMVGDNILTRTAGQEPSPALLYFPFGNISGLRALLAALLNGQQALLLDRFSLSAWRAYVARYRPAIVALPTVAVGAILAADVPGEDLAGITAVMSGAAPLSVDVQAAFEAKYGIPILLSYGATEFGGPVTQTSLDDRARHGDAKQGSVGRAYAGNRIRVRDPETGVLQPSGQAGRIEVLSERMGADWIATNDIGLIDEDGFLFLHGRADGAINRGGFKVLPEAIEVALCQHPAVAAACVVGIDDPRLGEVPGVAIVARSPDAPPSIIDLEAHMRQHVYATHIPVAWRFVPELPRNATLKIDRGTVRRLFADSPEKDKSE